MRSAFTLLLLVVVPALSVSGAGAEDCDGIACPTSFSAASVDTLPIYITQQSLGTSVAVAANYTFGPGKAFSLNLSAAATSHDHRHDPGPGPASKVPCTIQGCPDLTVDAVDARVGTVQTREAFASANCNVAEGTIAPGTHSLLRFTTTAPNVGPGPLHLGDPEDSPAYFTWGDCHDHWHLDGFAAYRLWTTSTYFDWIDARANHQNATSDQVLASHAYLGDGLLDGRKQGFCAIDSKTFLPGSPGAYWYCDAQGISPGWADTYIYSLDGQWVEITDVDDGTYILEIEINPDRVFTETDLSNNIAALGVLIRGA